MSLDSLYILENNRKSISHWFLENNEIIRKTYETDD